jgi:segregation and condensation protein B
MARLEAVLLVAGAPLSPRRLAQLATLADATEARTLINRLNAAFEQAGTPFRIERAAAGYRLFTLPQYAFWLGKLHQREAELKLSPPAMETLTIIAYRQPITRADIEAIRGVQCSEMVKQLMERGLVRIGGEDDSLGRPYLYETTRRFLEIFGLRDLEELPLAARLRRPGGTVVPVPQAASSAAPAAPPEAVAPAEAVG